MIHAHAIARLSRGCLPEAGRGSTSRSASRPGANRRCASDTVSLTADRARRALDKFSFAEFKSARCCATRYRGSTALRRRGQGRCRAIPTSRRGAQARRRPMTRCSFTAVTAGRPAQAGYDRNAFSQYLKRCRNATDPPSRCCNAQDTLSFQDWSSNVYDRCRNGADLYT